MPFNADSDDPGDSASFDCELDQVVTLLRDGLVDPGGIGLPPSLNIQGGLRLHSREFYSPGSMQEIY